jgi:hypothetical protein
MKKKKKFNFSDAGGREGPKCNMNREKGGY